MIIIRNISIVVVGMCFLLRLRKWCTNGQDKGLHLAVGTALLYLDSRYTYINRHIIRGPFTESDDNVHYCSTPPNSLHINKQNDRPTNIQTIVMIHQLEAAGSLCFTEPLYLHCGGPHVDHSAHACHCTVRPQWLLSES